MFSVPIIVCSYVELDDEGVVSTAVKEKSLKKDDEKRTVIVIDDDDDGEDDGDKHENDSNTGKTKGEDSVETCSVSDFGCQTSFDKMQGIFLNEITFCQFAVQMS